MKNFPKLSEGDLFVMNVLWEHGECKCADIMKIIKGKREWALQTMRTYLSRLVAKKLVGHKPMNFHEFVYYPLVSKADYAAAETSNILRKYFDSPDDMIVCLIERETLSKQQLEAIERTIMQAKEKRDD